MRIKALIRAIVPIVVVATALMTGTGVAQAHGGFGGDANVVWENWDCNHGQPTLIGCSPRPVAGPRYIGWTYLEIDNSCPVGFACAAVVRQSLDAWSWDGRSWSRAALPGGWVYVYPYTGAWRWAWTHSTGWVAVSGGSFVIR